VSKEQLPTNRSVFWLHYLGFQGTYHIALKSCFTTFLYAVRVVQIVASNKGNMADQFFAELFLQNDYLKLSNMEPLHENTTFLLLLLAANPSPHLSA
jgi:hypothetical protein